MRLVRVSNAGLWVESLGLRFLLDGMHGAAEGPYCGMDPAWEAYLFGSAPAADVLAFTHSHPDHFDPLRTARYLVAHPQTLVYAGPDVLAALVEQGVAQSRLISWEGPGPLGLSAFPTRHIGPKHRDLPHSSLVLQGEKTLLFTGDASPVAASFSAPQAPERPDILAAPFSFLLGNAPSRVLEGTIRPGVFCILHLPQLGEDVEHMRERARAGAAGLSVDVKWMELGEALCFA